MWLNCLILNQEKCFQITFGKVILDSFDFSINNLELNKTLIVKDLGVFFDSNLNYINNICSRN